MSVKKSNQHPCIACGKNFITRDLMSGVLVRAPVSDLIRQDYPGWSQDAFICHKDLNKYRADYVHSLLESERGELTSIEQEVVESLRQNELLSTNIDVELDQKLSFGENLADHIAEFGGSWMFLILFGIFIMIWIGINSAVMFWKPADPYPFILLNLILSCLAAIQAPVIMMSQNRQEAKDRLRAQHDYKINLKAELEVRQLHEKIDHLLKHQWEKLVEIQQIQLDLLTEYGRRQ